MPVADLTIKDAREKLGAKQDELGIVLEQAKHSDGQHHFDQVTHFGANVKGSIAVAEKFNQLVAECDELAKHAETLEAAEQGAKAHSQRMEVRGRPAMPGRKGDQHAPEIKSLGQLVAEEKSFAPWAKSGAGGGLSFSFDEAWPSDILAKGASFDTLGTKTLMTRAAGYAPESIRLPGFTEMATRPIQVLDILPMFQTDQAAVKYMEETTRTHAAAEKAEGAAYAESGFAFTERSSTVEKITDSVPVTDEQLKDVPMMNGYIDSRVTFGLRQRLDGQSIVGDGSSPNLRGLKNVSGIQTQAIGADPRMDAYFHAMKKIRTVGRAIPTHHLIHPDDWATIRLTRTADGVYIFGAPTDAGPDRLWSLPVVQSEAGGAGWGSTGSFQPQWVSLFERQGVDIQIGFVGTQFTEGKRTVRGDMRFALVWFRPAAFCEVTD